MILVKNGAGNGWLMDSNRSVRIDCPVTMNAFTLAPIEKPFANYSNAKTGIGRGRSGVPP
jgi:hypothetical protein